MERIQVQVWDKDSEVDDAGRVISSRKLWAGLSYRADTGNISETRDGKRWPNGYGDEFTYRDQVGVSFRVFQLRCDYYDKRGYLLRFSF